MRSLIVSCFLSLSFLLTATCAKAQSAFTIEGKVTDESEKPVNGATIFLDGTKLVTLTNAEGKFTITVPHPGSYHVLVKMIGYSVISRDIRLTGAPIELNFRLNIKPIVLRTVNVGSKSAWAKNYAIFKKEFLGTTKNADACVITNPDIIYFSTAPTMLYAEADDFLIIENKRLGYRIKYLLKKFEHSVTANTAYNGDVVFEEMQGTDAEKQEWDKNRLETYRGSMMHFLRAIYKNNTLQEGFVTNELYRGGFKNYYTAKLARIDEMTTPIDSSFSYFNFTGLRVLYAPDKTARYLKSGKLADLGSGDNQEEMLDPKRGSAESQLFLYLKNPVVLDARGAVFSSYLLSFLIRGAWTYKRVGDQLPFEYQPPAKN